MKAIDRAIEKIQRAISEATDQLSLDDAIAVLEEIHCDVEARLQAMEDDKRK
jgi:Mg/Co/Ni transporter MgtE